MARPLPSTEYLHECFSYDPETGLLTWKRRPLHHFKNAHIHAVWNTRFAGKKAGTLGPRGYFYVKIKQLRYFAHRTIWCMQTGAWPTQIDHKNRIGADNRWENLREATPQQNRWNRIFPTRSTPRGVYSTSSGRYATHAMVGRRAIHLGTFDTPEEAHEAWVAYVREMRGEFLRID